MGVIDLGFGCCVGERNKLGCIFWWIEYGDMVGGLFCCRV